MRLLVRVTYAPSRSEHGTTCRSPPDAYEDRHRYHDHEHDRRILLPVRDANGMTIRDLLTETENRIRKMENADSGAGADVEVVYARSEEENTATGARILETASTRTHGEDEIEGRPRGKDDDCPAAASVDQDVVAPTTKARSASGSAAATPGGRPANASASGSSTYFTYDGARLFPDDLLSDVIFEPTASRIDLRLVVVPQPRPNNAACGPAPSAITPLQVGVPATSWRKEHSQTSPPVSSPASTTSSKPLSAVMSLNGNASIFVPRGRDVAPSMPALSPAPSPGSGSSAPSSGAAGGPNFSSSSSSAVSVAAAVSTPRGSPSCSAPGHVGASRGSGGAGSGTSSGTTATSLMTSVDGHSGARPAAPTGTANDQQLPVSFHLAMLNDPGPSPLAKPAPCAQSTPAAPGVAPPATMVGGSMTTLPPPTVAATTRTTSSGSLAAAQPGEFSAAAGASSASTPSSSSTSAAAFPASISSTTNNANANATGTARPARISTASAASSSSSSSRILGDELRPYQMIGFSSSSSCSREVEQEKLSSARAITSTGAAGPVALPLVSGSNKHENHNYLHQHEHQQQASIKYDQFVEILQEQKALWSLYDVRDKVRRAKPGTKIFSPPFTLFGIKKMRLVFYPAGAEKSKPGWCAIGLHLPAEVEQVPDVALLQQRQNKVVPRRTRRLRFRLLVGKCAKLTHCFGESVRESWGFVDMCKLEEEVVATVGGGLPSPPDAGGRHVSSILVADKIKNAGAADAALSSSSSSSPCASPSTGPHAQQKDAESHCYILKEEEGSCSLSSAPADSAGPAPVVGACIAQGSSSSASSTSTPSPSRPPPTTVITTTTDVGYAARQAARTFSKKIKEECERNFEDKIVLGVEIIDDIDEHETLEVVSVVGTSTTSSFIAGPLAVSACSGGRGPKNSASSITFSSASTTASSSSSSSCSSSSSGAEHRHEHAHHLHQHDQPLACSSSPSRAAAAGAGASSIASLSSTTHVNWTLFNMQHKLAQYKKDQCLFSPFFSVSGLDDLRFKFYPNGKKEADSGWCSLYLEAPLHAELRCKFGVGSRKMSFDRLEKFGDESIWGFLSACKISDEVSRTAEERFRVLPEQVEVGVATSVEEAGAPRVGLEHGARKADRESQLPSFSPGTTSRAGDENQDVHATAKPCAIAAGGASPAAGAADKERTQTVQIGNCEQWSVVGSSSTSAGGLLGNYNNASTTPSASSCAPPSTDKPTRPWLQRAFREEARRSCLQITLEVLETKKLDARLNDSEDLFLKNHCFPDRRKHLLGELGRIGDLSSSSRGGGFRGAEPSRFRILSMELPDSAKQVALQKWDSLQTDPMTGEANKTKKWLDGLLALPFGDYCPPPVTAEFAQLHPSTDIANAAEITGYLEKTQKMLDDAVFGHEEAKEKILQLICQWIANPNSQSLNLGIQGPPGNGKTTLCRRGIAKALNRPFSQISLGGATDAALLEGHNFTYVGSTWGRLAGMLMETHCMNPIIFFDELDKVSDTPRGEEIVGVLTHLTDHSQNTCFTDRYFDGVPLDFSKALFIFSFNDERKLNPVLKDRLTVINTKGFSAKDQLQIAQQYLLPDLLKNVGMSPADVVLEDLDQLRYISLRWGLTLDDNGGVRGLKQALEAIILKVNKLRLVKAASRSGASGAAVGSLTVLQEVDVEAKREVQEASDDRAPAPSPAATTREGELNIANEPTPLPGAVGAEDVEIEPESCSGGTLKTDETKADDVERRSFRKNNEEERELVLPVLLTRKNVEWLLPQKNDRNESFTYMYT